jgi:hypothetical protein
VETTSESSEFLPLDFSDLDLPPLTPEEKSILGKELKVEDLLSFTEEKAPELMSLQGSYALRKIDEVVAEFVVDQMKTVELNPTLREHLERTTILKEWSGIPEESTEAFILNELITRANQLKFKLISKWLEEAEKTGLTSVGDLEYKHILPAMAAADRMYVKMRMDTPPIDSDERQRRGLTNQLAMVKQRGNDVVEVPYHEAFPEETAAMLEVYADLLAALGRLQKETTDPRTLDLIGRKYKYYLAVLEATASSDLEDWRKADTLLPGQIVDGSDVAHFHPIETGYMQDRILRSPEIGLRVADQAESEAQRVSAETKETMLKSFRDPRFAHLSAVGKSLTLLESSNATVRHFLGSGMEGVLKPAGQILPNEWESRVNGGVDSSLDVETSMQRYPLAKQAFLKVFGQKTFDETFPGEPNFSENVGGRTASHELGHAVGLVDGTRERLGESVLLSPYIEEWKATTAGGIGNYYVPVLRGEKDEKVLKGWVAGEIMTACRYAMSRNLPHVKAYIRHSMMLVKIAEEVGAVYKDETDTEFPWKIDLSSEKVQAYFEKLMNQFMDTMEIYGDGQEEDLNTHLSRELRSMPFMEFVCSCLEVPEGEKNTPECLAKRPCELLLEADRVHGTLKATSQEVGAVLAAADIAE